MNVNAKYIRREALAEEYQFFISLFSLLSAKSPSMFVVLGEWDGRLGPSVVCSEVGILLGNN